MADVTPVKLVPTGGGAGELREFAAGDTIPNAQLSANLAAFGGLAGEADRLPYFTGAGALSLATLTEQARALLGDADAAAMRARLELVKQASATDATVGRVLAVGAFGIGAPTGTVNVDSVLASGVYQAASTGGGTYPAGFVNGTIWVGERNRSPYRCNQILTDDGFGRVWTRHNNGVFGPWIELWGGATGRRIQGNFSAGSGDLSSRTVFQTATANNQTVISVMPNGTSRIAGFHAFNSGADLENCSRAAVNVTATDVTLQSDRLGTGAYLPLHLAVGAGGIAARFETDGRASLWSDVGGYSGSLTLKNPSGTTSRTLRVNNGDKAVELVNQANTAITHYFYDDGSFRTDKTLYFGAGGGGSINPGCLYSDINWGVIIRAARSAPAIAEYSFQDYNGAEIIRLASAASAYALHPVADNARPLGLAGARWSVVYAGSGTINTSDAREKTPVTALSKAELAAAKELAKEIGTYQWLAAVEEKGEGARHHAGLTVQRAIEVLESHSLNPFTYGFICYDEWEAEDPVYAEEGETVMQAGRAAGNRYSFRMDELALFIARGQAQRQDELEARIVALEAAV